MGYSSFDNARCGCGDAHMPRKIDQIKTQSFRPWGQMTAVPPRLHANHACHSIHITVEAVAGYAALFAFPRALGAPWICRLRPGLHLPRLALRGPAYRLAPHRFCLLYRISSSFASAYLQKVLPCAKQSSNILYFQSGAEYVPFSAIAHRAAVTTGLSS